jgi:Domain of unknown function (DUF4287)
VPPGDLTWTSDLASNDVWLKKDFQLGHGHVMAIVALLNAPKAKVTLELDTGHPAARLGG